MKAEKFIDHMYNSIGMANCGELDCERCPTAKVIIRECIPKFKEILDQNKEVMNKAIKKHPDKKDELIKVTNNEILRKFKIVLSNQISECGKVSGNPDNCKTILKKKIERLNDYKL